MNLNRKAVLGVDELYEYRESVKAITDVSQSVFAPYIKDFIQGLPCHFSVYNLAFAVLVAGDHPSLGNAFKLAFKAVFILKLGSAPDIIL